MPSRIAPSEAMEANRYTSFTVQYKELLRL